MTPEAKERLLALSDGLSQTGQAISAHRSRFARIAQRKENGTAPVAVVAHQLFQTPVPVAAQLVDLADIQRGHRILEPSAGLGRILAALPAGDVEIVAVDRSEQCCQALRKLSDLEVIQADFLNMDSGSLPPFDRVVMNPPFERGADIKHVTHACRFLKPGGLLVSVVLAAENRRRAFAGLEWHDLPPGTFKESNTGVDTAIVVYQRGR